MVRMKLADVPEVSFLAFDLSARSVDVYHDSQDDEILRRLETLEMGASLIDSSEVDEPPETKTDPERRVLWIAFAINFFFFALEIVMGVIAGSMGLVADSLDMLADCIVFGLALFAVGGTVAHKKSVARRSGYLQLVLVLIGFVEVLRRVFGDCEPPEFQMMIGVALFALIGNATALYLLHKSQNKEAHVQAGVLFTSNDVIINIGVIVAGVVVYMSGSNIPDLIVGTIVFIIVARGAFRILKLGA